MKHNPLINIIFMFGGIVIGCIIGSYVVYSQLETLCYELQMEKLFAENQTENATENATEEAPMSEGTNWPEHALEPLPDWANEITVEIYPPQSLCCTDNAGIYAEVNYPVEWGTVNIGATLYGSETWEWEAYFESSEASNGLHSLIIQPQTTTTEDGSYILVIIFSRPDIGYARLDVEVPYSDQSHRDS